MTDDPPQIRIENPLPVDRESKRRPSMVLPMIFMVGLAAIVLPLAAFIAAIGFGSQRGLDLSVVVLKWGLVSVGVLLAYGAAVGLYHTFLAMTGLDRGRRRD